MRCSHPLYEVPSDLWESVPSDIQEDCTVFHADDSVLVLAAPERLDDISVMDAYGDGIPVRYFRALYTPSPEEVCRALQGPPGPAGPAGMSGEPGVAPTKLAEIEHTLEKLKGDA